MSSGARKALQALAAIAALASAYCWLRSAWVNLPVMQMYPAGPPPPDPGQLVAASGFWNCFAAIFAALAAVIQAVVLWPGSGEN